MTKKRLLAVTILAAVLCTIIRYPIFLIKGSSMEPTLSDGNVLVCVRTKHVSYGDIVIGYQYNEDGRRLRVIKRLIGLPGDCIEVGRDYLKRNGEMLYESSYLYDLYTEGIGEWVVEDGCIFVLGDNRNDSYDSREAKQMKISDLVGRMIMHSR